MNIARANLELAKLNLHYTEVRAPIDGRISNRRITEGKSGEEFSDNNFTRE
jgi:multidrug resistance efflux pump